MDDRIEREIEEILRRAGDLPGSREPIPFRRRRRRLPSLPPAPEIDPARLFFAAAALLVGGLVASAFWGPAIWIAFAGIVLFIAAFVWSFVRSPGERAPAGRRRVYWRDRYIEYEPTHPSFGTRIRRMFRRR